MTSWFELSNVHASVSPHEPGEVRRRLGMEGLVEIPHRHEEIPHLGIITRECGCIVVRLDGHEACPCT
jgi:hypothetical protein